MKNVKPGWQTTELWGLGGMGFVAYEALSTPGLAWQVQMAALIAFAVWGSVYAIVRGKVKA